MNKVKNYIENNKERLLEELMELLRIPSVSADTKYAKDVIKTAEFVRDKMLKAGAENVEICETAGYPIVYGEKITNPSMPTVLVYGH